MSGAALESAFSIDVIVSIDGACATSSHLGMLDEPALASCLIDYVGSLSI